jgi:hypothetical protein
MICAFLAGLVSRCVHYRENPNPMQGFSLIVFFLMLIRHKPASQRSTKGLVSKNDVIYATTPAHGKWVWNELRVLTPAQCLENLP